MAVLFYINIAIQQFYIAKMMILIFTIIAMRSYLYSVCLVCIDLKNTYFIEHPWVIAFKYSICDMENDRNLNYVPCLNLAPVEKAWFLGQLNIAPVEKGLWRRWNIPSWFIAPMEKAWFYKRFFFEAVMFMVKDKRKYNKNLNKNWFYTLYEVDRTNVTSSFWGIWTGLYFLLLCFCYHCRHQLVKGQLQQKSAAPQFLLAWGRLVTSNMFFFYWGMSIKYFRGNI